MPDIAVGDPATVALASGAKVAGTVRLLGARVDTRTGLSLVRIALPQRPDIRPGGYARAMFTNITAPVPSVPEAAIHSIGRAPCRERVLQYVEISVVADSLKKTQNTIFGKSDC